LRERNGYQYKVFTTAYEPPRVFSFFSLSVRRYVGDVLLVINGGDLIAHLPAFFMGFLHRGEKFFTGSRLRDILFPFTAGPHYRGSVENALEKKFKE
jgi:hypothetical protein